MQVLSRPAAPSLASTRRAAAAAPSKIALPVRPSVIRRFKESDDYDSSNRTVEETKVNVQETARSAQNSLQKAAEPVDYDSQYKVNPLIPAFTRRREVFIGRLAIIGIVAAGFWEWFLPSHPNILLQVSGALNLAGLPAGPAAALAIIGFIAGYNALEGLAPGSPTFSRENQEDVARRRPGPPNDQFQGIGQLLGISGWGFSKANEVFNGRMAMIGFAAAILQQLRLGGLYGPGPLAQVATFLNIPVDNQFWSSVPSYFIGFTIFALAFSYLRGNTGEKTRFDERDMY
jgi:photosystem II protein